MGPRKNLGRVALILAMGAIAVGVALSQLRALRRVLETWLLVARGAFVVDGAASVSTRDFGSLTPVDMGAIVVGGTAVGQQRNMADWLVVAMCGILVGILRRTLEARCLAALGGAIVGSTSNL